MSFNRTFSFFIFIIINLFSVDVNSQCEFAENMVIHDDSTAVYSVNISGAINDNLTTNGICGILIKFKHTIIGDVNLSLTSPSGQSVTLLGPTAPLSNLTSFTTWDISFTPCLFATSPDFGFLDVWDNLQPWGQFGVYTGTYHPANGCLEDFNLGSINGTWSLIVDDVNRFDTGIIESFQIIFCDETGIDCEQCDARSGQISNPDIIACVGDSLLDFTLAVDYNNGQSNPIDYTNEFIVFKDDELLEYNSDPSVRFYSSGSYIICNIDYNSSQLDLLPQPGAIATNGEIDSLVKVGGACVSLGDSCMTIEIIEPAASVDFFEEICAGDSILFLGVYFKDEGTFSLSKGGGLCDSVFNLNLDVIEMSPLIATSKPGLDCENDNLLLTVNHEETDKVILYNWYSFNGNIVSNNINQTINIDSPGIYYVETIFGSCIQTDSFEVIYAQALPVITLTADTVDCIGAEATVTISSNKTLIDRDWSGPEILGEGTLTIKVGKPGIYTVIATDIDGCIQVDSIDVIGDLDPPQLIFDIDNLSCSSDSGSILISGNVIGDTITWLNQSDLESETFAYITTEGEVYIQSVAQNNCSQIDTVFIGNESYTIQIDVEDDSITCDNLILSPNTFITDSIGQVTYLWDYPSIQTSVLSDPILNEVGIYSVEVQDSNGCTGMTTFEIDEYISPPIILVKDTIFTCIDDSIQIQILNHTFGYRYRWTGPFGFMSMARSPFIYNTGDYEVTIIDRYGCINSANITVVEGAGLPISDFVTTSLDCFNDSAYITPQLVTNLLFEWEGDGLVSDTFSSNAIVTSGGLYYLTITDILNCQNTYEFLIEDQRSYLSIEIAVDSLDCVTDTVKPSFIISETFNSVTWVGPEVFIDTSANITIPGTYYVEFVGENGCLTYDSIEVIFDNELPIINIEQSIIICEPDTALQVASSLNATNYTWKKDNIIVGESDSIYIQESGEYNVIVENNNGCVDSLVVNILIDTIAPDLTLSIDNVISCDDSLSTISSGPIDLDLIYEWSGPEILVDNVNTIDVNGQGQYFLKTTNSQGCISFDSFNVQDTRIIPNFTSIVNDINCYSIGSIQIVDLININNIIWTGPQVIPDGTESINITTPGLYNITANSLLGCEKSIDLEIIVDTLSPQINEFINDTINCFVPKVNIGFEFANPIDSIQWNGPISFVTNYNFALIDEGGIYNLTVYGANGCVLNETVNIIEDVELPISSIIGDTLTCLRSKVLLTLDDNTNVGQINWIGPGVNEVSEDLFINQPGLYIANIQGDNGCIYTDSIYIVEDKLEPSINIQDTFYLPCNGDSVSLFINSEDNIVFFRWVGNGFFSDLPNPKLLDPQTVYLFAAGPNGCNSFDSTIVVQDLRPIEFDLNYDSITCSQPFANLVAIDVEDDESFFWIKPDNEVLLEQNAISDQDGIHKLIVNRGNNCLDSIEFVVLIDTIPPDVNIQFNDFYQCDNTIVPIEGAISSFRDNYIFEWLTSNGGFEANVSTLTPLVNQPGIYMLNAIDTLNGCENIAEISVEELPQFFLSIDIDEFDPLCFGESTGLFEIVNFVGAVGNTQLFFEGILIEDLFIDSLSAGEYYIKAVDSFGCIIDTVITLGDGLDYNIEIIGDTIVDLGDSLLLEFIDDVSGLTYDSISWYTTDSVLCADCEEILPYIYINTFVVLQTTTIEGCIAVDSILIKVNAEIEYDFPTAFSPDGNNNNDTYRVSALKEFDRLERVMIFDRWGTVMHQEYGVDINNQIGWDGTYNGQYALPGVYAVLMDIRLKNGEVIKKATDLTLIR